MFFQDYMANISLVSGKNRSLSWCRCTRDAQHGVAPSSDLLRTRKVKYTGNISFLHEILIMLFYGIPYTYKQCTPRSKTCNSKVIRHMYMDL
jgi:hypothetical protein